METLMTKPSYPVLVLLLLHSVINVQICEPQLVTIEQINTALKENILNEKNEKPKEKALNKHDLRPGMTVGDIILTQTDIDTLFDDNQSTENHHERSKRKIVNFSKHPMKKWNMPIKYYIDKNTILDEADQKIIRNALRSWENMTCIVFTEVDNTTNLDEKHLYFTNASDRGCSSLVGKATLMENLLLTYRLEEVTSLYSQPVHLGEGCYRFPGIAMHEIGHALGLYHEAQRFDRDEHVMVLYNNIEVGESINFSKENSATVGNIPYDLGSLMQYGALDFSNDIRQLKFTMIPLESDKVFVMGQRVEIGFYDAKTVNQEYCNVQVYGQSHKMNKCQHDGYPDPKDKGNCICPPEWAGQHCQHLKTGSPGCYPHQGKITHTNSDVGKEFSLFSPNYRNKKNWTFTDGDECFWIINVPQSYHISWWIGSDSDRSSTGYFMGMTSFLGSCMAWVEIRKLSEIRGQRVCGIYNNTKNLGKYGRPINSLTNRLVISFRSFEGANYEVDFQRRGFQLKYKIVHWSASLTTRKPFSWRDIHRTTTRRPYIRRYTTKRSYWWEATRIQTTRSTKWYYLTTRRPNTQSKTKSTEQEKANNLKWLLPLLGICVICFFAFLGYKHRKKIEKYCKQENNTESHRYGNGDQDTDKTTKVLLVVSKDPANQHAKPKVHMLVISKK